MEAPARAIDWNLQELKELCERKGVAYPSIYANSITWRYQRAVFHKDKAKEVWKDFIRSPFQFNDDRYNEAQFIYEAHVESCIFSLHTMSDILSQIINAILLNNEFSEENVSIKKVKNAIETNFPDIFDRITVLLNSYEFRYIEAFCNISKHRRIILSDLHGEFGNGYRNEEDFVFDAFDFKGTNYPKTWARDIIDNYREKLFQLIADIGESINNYER